MILTSDSVSMELQSFDELKEYIAVTITSQPYLSVNEFKVHKVELYSNITALPWRVDRGVLALLWKININRAAIDILTCLHLSERQNCIYSPLTIVVSMYTLHVSMLRVKIREYWIKISNVCLWLRFYCYTQSLSRIAK